MQRKCALKFSKGSERSVELHCICRRCYFSFGLCYLTTGTKNAKCQCLFWRWRGYYI